MDAPARRPCASMIPALRSLDELMIGEEAARPRWVQASKQMVSIAPRIIAAVTGSTLAAVGSGVRLTASFLFNSNVMAGAPSTVQPMPLLGRKVPSQGFEVSIEPARPWTLADIIQRYTGGGLSRLNP